MISKTILAGRYQAPETKEIGLLTEVMLCQSPSYGAKGSAGAALGLDDDDYDYGSF